jgi:thiol-disulfide isomerase/thioredoxin
MQLLNLRLTAVAMAVVLLGALPSLSHAALKAGDTIPDLSSYKLEGALPASFKDKVVMLDFWASWCDPCKESFPTMEDLHRRYGPKGLLVIAVNVDENRADMEEFLKKHPATFSLVRDGSQKLVEKAGISTMPGSFLIDRQGKIRFIHAGYKGTETKKKYEQEIETLLKQ